MDAASQFPFRIRHQSVVRHSRITTEIYNSKAYVYPTQEKEATYQREKKERTNSFNSAICNNKISSLSIQQPTLLIKTVLLLLLHQRIVRHQKNKDH